MNTALKTDLITVAQTCLQGAATNTMTFPEIVGTLINAGFEGYTVDFRRGVNTYYLPSGEPIELPFGEGHADEPSSIAATFDASAVQAAVREAQQQVPGYTYAGFCTKVMAAGCAGYMVSFLGQRVVYYGRTAETHVELFPQ